MKLENLFEMYTAHVLNPESKRELIERFPPKYPEVVGHHTTVQFGVPKDTQAPDPASLQIVGYADDGEGLEALVVAVDGEVRRSDGSLYHITWSLDRSKGRKPVDSNALVQMGYDPVDNIPIKTTPEVLK